MGSKSIVAAAIATAGTVAAVSIHRSYRKDVKEYQEKTLQDESSVVEVRQSADGTPVQIQYKIQEPSTAASKDSPAALVLHASGGGHDQGIVQASKVLPDTYRIIAISRPGYLKSTAISSVEEQCVDLKRFLEKIGVAKISILFGMSMGSAMAIRYASLYPASIESLILLSPWVPYAGDDAVKPQKPDLPAPPQWILNTFFGSEFVKWISIKAGMGDSMCGVTRQTTEESKAFVSQFLNTLFPVSDRFEGFCIDVYQWMPLRLSSQELEAITAPILQIEAEDDAQVKPSEHRFPCSMQSQITSFVRPRGGHMLVSDYEIVQKEIQVFLDKKAQ